MIKRKMKLKLLIIFLLILLCLLPYSFWGKDGFRRELLAKDYFSDIYISIATVLLKANSNDYFPYSENTFKYTRFYSFKNIAWLKSELDLLLPKLKLMEKFDENLTGDYFRLAERPEDSLQYELLEADNAAIFFITINEGVSCFAITKAANKSNAYLFSNMSKRFFDSADPDIVRFYSYLEIPLPLHHISDERIHDLSNECFRDIHYLISGSQADFISFYQHLNRFDITLEDQGFVLSENKDRGSSQTIFWPVRFTFIEEDGKSFFFVSYI